MRPACPAGSPAESTRSRWPASIRPWPRWCRRSRRSPARSRSSSGPGPDAPGATCSRSAAPAAAGPGPAPGAPVPARRRWRSDRR
ncbi:hypothetical protein G6F65_023121 [Rhizopus arrhizus]|nr:hypothetical protein G6F65_023121 [Rhizopus arrhizus]